MQLSKNKHKQVHSSAFLLKGCVNPLENNSVELPFNTYNNITYELSITENDSRNYVSTTSRVQYVPKYLLWFLHISHDTTTTLHCCNTDRSHSVHIIYTVSQPDIITTAGLGLTLLLCRGWVFEPGAADGLSSLHLTAPPHVPDHILTHALHVLVGCRRRIMSGCL